MKHLGLGNRRTIKNQIKSLPNLIKIMKGEKMEIKLRKIRKPETKKRNMAEKQIEADIIFFLTMDGIVVCKSGEQSTYNSKHVLNGMSDLMVFIPNKGIIFMEVKSPDRVNEKDGGLRKSQVKFKELCKSCLVKYVVVYSLQDAKEAIK